MTFISLRWTLFVSFNHTEVALLQCRYIQFIITRLIKMLKCKANINTNRTCDHWSCSSSWELGLINMWHHHFFTVLLLHLLHGGKGPETDPWQMFLAVRAERRRKQTVLIAETPPLFVWRKNDAKKKLSSYFNNAACTHEKKSLRLFLYTKRCAVCVSV